MDNDELIRALTDDVHTQARELSDKLADDMAPDEVDALFGAVLDDARLKAAIVESLSDE